MGFTLTNSSKFKKRVGATLWYDWTAFITCDDSDSLNEIDYVEYYLHASYINPIRRIYSIKESFALKMLGWTPFNLKANIIFKDKKRESILLEHRLQLNK